MSGHKHHRPKNNSLGIRRNELFFDGKKWRYKIPHKKVFTLNAQSIKLWLEFAIPKLGFKSVVKLIEDLNNDK